MTNYPRSAYGTRNPNAGKPANGDFGAWGGYKWPNCAPASLMGTTDYTSKFGQRLRVQLRSAIVPLAGLMFAIADKHNYPIYANRNGENWGPWGASCRPIAGSNNPSGHSGALAMDINAPNNPYSTTFASDMPPAMVADFEACGWFWGGRYSGKYDAMHFSYCWAPADVARHMAIARQILGSGGGGGGGEEPTEEEKDEADIMTKADDILTQLRGLQEQLKAVNIRLDQLPVRFWTTPITNDKPGGHANELLAAAVASSGGAAQSAQVAATIAQKNRQTILGPPEGKDRLGDLWNQGQEILEAVGGDVTPPPVETTTYTVVSGDTLGGIAKKLGVTLEALRAANPQITNPDALNVGDMLNVPKA